MRMKDEILLSKSILLAERLTLEIEIISVSSERNSKLIYMPHKFENNRIMTNQDPYLAFFSPILKC